MLFSTKSLLRRRTDRSERLFTNSFKVKRVLDILCALAGLIAFTPILLLSAAAIRLGGAREIIFKQRRVGLDGKPFDILKLATMREDAHLDGPLVSASRDPRVTRAGRIVRGFCLNELPQFVNVLRGEMSLVGPRPEVPRYVEHWPPEVKRKLLSVRPGITGLATIHIWDEASLLDGRKDMERAYVDELLPRKLRVELWYVRNRTFWLDLRILVLTLIKALGGRRLLLRSKSGKRQRLTKMSGLPMEEEA